MSNDYLHGSYGQQQAVGTKVASKSQSAMVYVGTAPVQTVAGGGDNVNTPILVNNIAEARSKFGYSSDWAKYTLCEAMHVHFELKGMGPLVFINVLDPATHKGEGGTASLTPDNGRVTIQNAEDAVLDSLVVKSGDTAKTKGTDYTVSYDFNKKAITIAEVTSGALGTSALTITYDTVDATAVDADDVIGSSDGAGLNTGIFAIKNVYQATGYIPSFLMCPGFSSEPSVHAAMAQNSRKVNGHWDAYMLTDIPIISNSTAITLATAATWKAANGYNKQNETVYFPLAQGTDGATYHLSVLAAANLQELLFAQEGIPYKTASNTECAIIENLYLGESSKGRVFDDSLINEKLNKNGIASAAYVGGRWVIWGAHSAEYNQTDGNQINVSETNYMMLFYLSNDFQHRRTRDVDKPLTSGDLKTMISEEQGRLDGLVKTGALTYGEVHINADDAARSDVMNGDYTFTFNVTTTPIAKSLTAIVNWTDEGFTTFFADFE